MPQLLDDLYPLSPNASMFDELRREGCISMPAGREVPTAEKAMGAKKSSLLRRLPEAVVPVLESGNDSQLQELVVDADLCGKVMILGELILTLSALNESGGKEEAVEAVADWAFGLAREVTAGFGEAADRIGEDEELLWHGSALREWAHLLAGHFGGMGDSVRQAEMLYARAAATTSVLICCPHLVGPAYLEMGLAAESLGDVEMAKRCCDSVRKDLRYLLDRPDAHDRLCFEEFSTLYWLQRSCEELRRLAPGHPEAARDLERVVEIRTKRDGPDDVSEPRFGPIAWTYLGKDRFLVLVLRDFLERYDPSRHEECVAAIWRRYGCSSNRVEFYHYAIGSYHLQQTVLSGVITRYDESFQEVFAALDVLRREGTLGL
jgi:hypothetical protein